MQFPYLVSAVFRISLAFSIVIGAPGLGAYHSWASGLRSARSTKFSFVPQKRGFSAGQHRLHFQPVAEERLGVEVGSFETEAVPSAELGEAALRGESSLSLESQDAIPFRWVPHEELLGREAFDPSMAGPSAGVHPGEPVRQGGGTLVEVGQTASEFLGNIADLSAGELRSGSARIMGLGRGSRENVRVAPVAFSAPAGVSINRIFERKRPVAPVPEKNIDEGTRDLGTLAAIAQLEKLEKEDPAKALEVSGKILLEKGDRRIEVRSVAMDVVDRSETPEAEALLRRLLVHFSDEAGKLVKPPSKMHPDEFLDFRRLDTNWYLRWRAALALGQRGQAGVLHERDAVVQEMTEAYALDPNKSTRLMINEFLQEWGAGFDEDPFDVIEGKVKWRIKAGYKEKVGAYQERLKARKAAERKETGDTAEEDGTPESVETEGPEQAKDKKTKGRFISKRARLWIVALLGAVVIFVLAFASSGGSAPPKEAQTQEQVEKPPVPERKEALEEAKEVLASGKPKAADELQKLRQMAEREIQIENRRLEIEEKRWKLDQERREEELARRAAHEAAQKQFWNTTLGRMLMILFTSFAPILLLAFLMFKLWKRQQEGGTITVEHERKSGKLKVKPQTSNVRFDDVAGIDSAKEDLKEVVSYLKDPGKSIGIGAKIPKGILLAGGPGLGKTLLAKAVAGEAGKPFYYISGSEFVEKYVGEGASRVRDLFKIVRETGGVLFIDEIDAVAKRRGGVNSSDEREQTLNQILVEMDGFEGNSNFVVLAATNRPDVLDPAVIRPGRFNKVVHLTAPEIRGREAILDVHGKEVAFHPEVDFELVARRTAGQSGADLENIINEAALAALRANREWVTNDDLNKAIVKNRIGQEIEVERSEWELDLVAGHEAAHVLVGYGAHKRNKKWISPMVTILPHLTKDGGKAGGFAELPEKKPRTRREFIARIAGASASRYFEKHMFGDLTYGVSGDFEEANRLARLMVEKLTMGERTGKFVVLEQDGPFGRVRLVDPETEKKIKQDIDDILDEAEKLGKKILTSQEKAHAALAEALREKETLLRDEIVEIIEENWVKDEAEAEE